MPEGPEIRREADRIGRALTDERLADVYFGLPRLARQRQRLLATTVVSVAPHGKAMLIRFDNDLTLYSHNQLYGRWYVRPRGELPKTGRSLRVALHTETQSALLYSASEIAVLTEPELAEHPFLSRLGPDILDTALTWRDISRRLAETEFCNRALGSLYLDQHFIAGIGNYMRSETLFFAGLHPGWKPSQLTRKERNELARQTLAVADRAYRQRGVTNRDRHVKALKKAGVPRSQFRFSVFGRDGEPCFDCGTTIARRDVNGRRLYVCPGCQPAPD